MVLALYVVLGVLAWTAVAHGTLKEPPHRLPGPRMLANCGQQVYNKDRLGNVQDYLQTGRQQKDFNEKACDLGTCKGATLQDNMDRIQSYTTGQRIAIQYTIAAPHTGTATLRILNMRTKTSIDPPLKSFALFASNSRPAQPNESSFSVIMPDLHGQCTRPGDCVLQFLWDARSIDQTYPSCVDFVVDGKGQVKSGAGWSESFAIVRRQRNETDEGSLIDNAN